MAVIIDHGMREMLVEQRDVFYYLTLMNENYAQPDLLPGVVAEVIRGCYKFATFSPVAANDAKSGASREITLLGSGAILTEVIRAGQQLAEQGVTCHVFSVTSWSELARDGLQCEQGASTERVEPFVTQQLASGAGPIIAATDYVRALAESIRAYVPTSRRYVTLGTDGFGRSDTRAELREFFRVDAASICAAALRELGA
jgi:pyruvate dehydrogenase E1 component